MDIKISNVQPDNDTLLTKKTLELGVHKFDSPFKLLDFNDASILNILYLNQNYLKKIDLIERSKIIRKKTYIAEVHNPDANFPSVAYESLKNVNFLKNKLIINSLTFDFNPLEIDSYEDYLISFLHLYHGKSDILLIPNLKAIKYEQPHLFSWNEIFKLSNEIPIEVLLQKLGIDWISGAKVEKANDGTGIKVFTEKNTLSLKLCDGKNKVELKVDDRKINEFTVKRENGKLNIYDKPQKLLNVPLNDYLKYIEIANNELDFKNSKPIFTPLPLKYGVKVFRDVLRDYIDKGYKYFWLDFEGASSFSKSALVRAYHEIINKAGLVNKVVLYATNISREINPDSKQIECDASDVLASPLGVDIIGVNRAPQRGGDIKPLPIEEIIKHKARFLDRENYYYVRYSDFKRQKEFFEKYSIDIDHIKRNPKFYSNFINTFEINEEFNHHKNIMLEENSLLGYLSEKKSITPQKMKNFKKIITGKVSSNASLFDFI